MFLLFMYSTYTFNYKLRKKSGFSKWIKFWQGWYIANYAKRLYYLIVLLIHFEVQLYVSFTIGEYAYLCYQYFFGTYEDILTAESFFPLVVHVNLWKYQFSVSVQDFIQNSDLTYYQKKMKAVLDRVALLQNTWPIHDYRITYATICLGTTTIRCISQHAS